MRNILILGGTTEATALAQLLAERRERAVLSYAGRVDSPRAQPIPVRTGGFGGVQGLVEYLCVNNVTHLVDATHPFAAQMSANAVAGARQAGVPLVALTRPAWQPVPGDDWQRVPDIPAAVQALAGGSRRIFLALGRMHLAEFAAQPQHHYILRLVDPPVGRLPLPDATVIVSRGPFTVEGDREVMQDHGVDIVVCKNAGGDGASAKLAAARELGLPVLMIDRPVLPPRREVHEVAEVLEWLDHSANLGV
ncbi:cobalt-precorrin-6A reductase [Tabrizicola sp. J26]|uniref:cobalt-precorrin-6A reductase n=1 Tax=Alitabrizicola rongguiensis TaxID=2909234 RepID=UPI001F40C0A0|nr:cobalt-precorrin-6A reductase [Tabrizicola rongguiensis]MCF1710203.1 cobalt-precorrin-6A reductase [Tabrizicola rongguiensis]